MSSPSTSTPAFIHLKGSESKLAKRLVPYLICLVGLAVNEGARKKAQQLHEESLHQYLSKVDALDIGNEELVKK